MTADFQPGDQSDDCNIVCPYCGYRWQADPCDGDANEDPMEDECGECGNKYIRYASFSITYHTKPKNQP